MTCPNSDPQFDKILSNYVDINSPDYPQKRRQIYYFICIWVRLALYTFIYINREKEWVPYVVGVLALLSVSKLGSDDLPGRQWWSKRFQLLMAVLLAAASVGRVAGVVTDSRVIPGLLYLSLLGGIFQSLTVKFC